MASRYAHLQIHNSKNDIESECLSDDDFPENQDSDVELEDVLAEIREDYRHGLLQNNESVKTENTATDPQSVLNNAFDQIKENENFRKIGCADCSNPRKATHVSSFKKGQHISMPGQYFSTYVKIQRKQKNIYDHHAIIKEIKNTDGTFITMVLIHFTSANGKLQVYEGTQEFDLREKDICIVDYIFPRHDPIKIVARAESILSKRDKFKTYNVLLRNCEHFATWCVVGEGESFQVQSLKQKIMNAATRLFGAGTRIWKVVLRLFYISSDEIAVTLRTAVPEITLGAGSFLYFVYCLLKTALLFRDYYKGKMCKSCFKGKLSDLWLTFGAFGLTSAFTYIIMHFVVAAIPGVGIPLLVLLILLSLAFQIAVPKIRKALSSPFTTDRVKVTALEQISIGDVISQSYHGIKHTSIVTEVKIINQQQTKGFIKLVHYGSSGFFKTRIIVEESFDVDIDTSRIDLLDCEPLSTFPANVVVSRARSRIGESKWDAVSNRSDHFAYWAKVQQSEDQISDDICNDEIKRPLSKAKASLFVATREIHHIEDIRIGDVVKSCVIGLIDNTGIVSSVKYFEDSGGRNFELEVFTYNFSSKVTRNIYTIDLNKHRLYKKVYNNALCLPMRRCLQNARDMEDEKGTWWTTEGFVQNCIENKFEERVKVTSLDQVAIGDVLIQRFRGIKYTTHTSIVTQVKIINDTQTKGVIRVIHYWYSALLCTNEIVEGNVEIDLENSNIYLLVRQSPVFNPDVVVSRARSRVGETKWNILSNRSYHLAYWAKFQQYEHENDDDTCDDDVRTSLSKTETLQFKEKIEIHDKGDLRVGDVVKSDAIGIIDNTGILSSVRSFDGSNKRIFIIEVYTYTCLMAVSCKTYTIDLKKHRLYVMIYGPEKYQCLEQRLVNAKKMTVDKGCWWSTEGFIEHCLGIKYLDRIKVVNLDQIEIGDVILQRIHGIRYIRHTSIVSHIEITNEKQTKGLIRHIHYGESTSFGTKEIVEENIEIDLEKASIYLLHSSKSSFTADEVLRRARIRLGETKWDMSSNRSDHFALWAKYKQDENEITDKETREIHCLEDIKIGDVVKSDVIGKIDDTGILSSVKSFDSSNGRKFEIEVYTYNISWKVSCTKYIINLQKERLYVKTYNPAQCQSVERRLQNARDMTGEKGWWWTTEGFIKYCVKVKSTKDGKVTCLDQIHIGDVISQRIRGIKNTSHQSVVTRVNITNDKKTRGCIRLIHYRFLFSKIEIVEENVKVDIERSVIYLLDNKIPSFPPDVVVSRARSRIGETKWNVFSNRSDHFAYWAKYQTDNDFIVDETCKKYVKISEERSDAPRWEKRREIHNVGDLKIGDVVTSDAIGIIDNTGLLSSVRYLKDVDDRKFKVEVFTYTFARIVTRRTYTIDLNKDRLYVQLYGRANYQSMEKRLQKARDKENDKGSWWTTEGFIEHCLDINPGYRVKITNLDQIGIGDVISQRIQGVKYTCHTSIVSEINIQNDTTTKGCIHMIHYGSFALYGKRRILEEKVEIDIEKSCIYLLQCQRPTFPSVEVVIRARSRIGETKWNLFSNRSYHFAYWAKFQKYEDEIVDETCNEDFIKSSSRLDVPIFF